MVVQVDLDSGPSLMVLDNLAYLSFFFFFQSFFLLFFIEVFIEFVTILLLFSFMFWFFCYKACGILAPRLGIKLASPALEVKALTTGLPGKSLFPFKQQFIEM